MKFIPAIPSFFTPRRTIRALGLLGMAGGAFLSLLAPLELITFSYFAEGGRFHYPGFGIGSFMGLAIIAQVAAYSLLGAAGLVLGFGHLRLRRWVRPGMTAAIYTWWIIGAPVCVMAFFILAGTKDLTLAGGVLAILGLALSYSLVPAALARFYNSAWVRLALEPAGSQPGAPDDFPAPLLALAGMGVILMIIFNLLILCNGTFPLFGRWLTGMPGAVALILCIGWAALVTWGITQRCRWAWWGMLALTGLFGLSCLVTFSWTSYADLLRVMAFPAYEIGFLGGIPARGIHFAVLSGLPLALTGGMAFRARKYFYPAGPRRARGAVTSTGTS